MGIAQVLKSILEQDAKDESGRSRYFIEEPGPNRQF
jgi:hypothetical protein